MFSANNINYKSLISFLAAQVVIMQYRITAMPENIIRSIALLWRLQFLLESKDPEKYVKETTSYHAFRAAFDLFKLRAHFDPNLQSRVEFWQPYYDQCKADAERRRKSNEERGSRFERGGRNNRRSSSNSRSDYKRGERRSGRSEAGSFENFNETHADRQERMNKARDWRRAMNLEP